jgi:transketolase
LRSIPNINIISPADGLETVKSLQAALISKNSCYIRLTGTANNKIIYNSDYDFKIGKSVKLKDGNDITIFCNGAITAECLKASQLFVEKGLTCKVINMHTIKPIDDEAIVNSLDSKLIITVEEHNIIGGLSSAVSEVKSKFSKSPPQIVFGINDKYSKAGEYEYLKIKYGLSAENIVTTALKNINS